VVGPILANPRELVLRTEREDWPQRHGGHRAKRDRTKKQGEARRERRRELEKSNNQIALRCE
jgi:hypothetical protein